MDVDRGLGPRAHVELSSGGRVRGPSADVREDLVAGRHRPPAFDLLCSRSGDSDPQRHGKATLPWKNGRESLDERVHGVESGTPVQARVEVALPGAHADVEVAEPSKSGVEGGDAFLHHVAVEDERNVCSALVGGNPLDHRLAPDFLLGVEREANVDGEVSRGGELARGLDEHEEVRLVVCNAPRIEPAVPLRELERGRGPELERVGRLDVKVRVAEDGGSRLSPVRRGNLPDDERPPAVPAHDVRLATRAADPGRDPVGRGYDVVGVRGISADGRDGDQLCEPIPKLLVTRLHGRGVYSGGWRHTERLRCLPR